MAGSSKEDDMMCGEGLVGIVCRNEGRGVRRSFVRTSSIVHPTHNQQRTTIFQLPEDCVLCIFRRKNRRPFARSTRLTKILTTVVE